MYLDIFRNLALLVALSSISAFLALRWPRHGRVGSVVQGVLFGAVAVLGMLRPLNLGPGLIFDGRSVMVSLAALYFGPWAAVPAMGLTIACRLCLGGAGALTGSAVVLSSAGLGLLARNHLMPSSFPPSARQLYVFGLVVHVAMLALMFTLPGSGGLDVVRSIGLPILVLYPLATILAGRILSDRVDTERLIQALRDGEERYRQLFNSGNDAIMVFPLTHAGPLPFAEVNEVACTRYGRSREELLRMRPADLEAPGQEGLREQMLARLTRDGHGVIEMVHVDRSGHTLSVEISGRLFARAGQSYVLAIVRDISERKRAEEMVTANDERFRRLFDSAPDAIFWVDAETGLLTRCNAAAETLTGRRREELIGQPQAILHPPTTANAYLRLFQEAGVVPTQRRVEAEVMRADGLCVPVEITPSVVHLDGRTVVQCVFRDVTERRRAEGELASQVDELRRWYHSTLGREERIAALKGEVNALAVRLHQAPPYASADGNA